MWKTDKKKALVSSQNLVFDISRPFYDAYNQDMPRLGHIIDLYNTAIIFAQLDLQQLISQVQVLTQSMVAT